MELIVYRFAAIPAPRMACAPLVNHVFIFRPTSARSSRQRDSGAIALELIIRLRTWLEDEAPAVKRPLAAHRIILSCNSDSLSINDCVSQLAIA